MNASWRRSAWVILAVASLSAIVRATLFPTTDVDTGTFHWCVLCGDGGLADFIANVILFVPAAFALYGAGWPARRVLPLLCALSVSIEIAQLWIPGRESSLGDIVSNTSGAAVGVAASWWWRRRRRSTAGAAALAAFALLVVAAAGAALRPSFPPAVYYGEWTPDLGGFDAYHGRVMSASLGGLSVPSWDVADSRAVRARLIAGDALLVRAVAGPAPLHLAPLFRMADARGYEVLLLGVDGADLVLDPRTRTSDLRLRGLAMRWPRALASVRPGDSLALAAWRSGADWCLRLNAQSRCGVRYAADQVWNVIAALPGRLAGREPFFGCLFVALLAFPVGLLAPRRAGGWLAVATLLAGLALVPRAVGLASLTLADAVTLVASVAVGLAVPMADRDPSGGREGTLPV